MPHLPRMFHLRQDFIRPVVDDVSVAAKRELSTLLLDKKITAGQRIGITVGSRGISNLLPILKAVIDCIRSSGGEPYLLAAMGSHGGGSESGQKEVLESLGITEEALGAQVVTCTECRVIAHTRSGLPVYILDSALDMDWILAVNRVKTHTSFKGRVESGLIKEIVVGLGGPEGARHFHQFGSAELPGLLLESGEAVLDNLPILGGLAIVENAYEETAVIRAVESSSMIDQESELLLYSKSLMPSLPVDNIDILIIEEIGKNFSGTGMDTNIIGRMGIRGVPEPVKPSIKRIALLDLSEESHGNAAGIGLADFVTRRLVDKMDRHVTYVNCLTSTFVVRAAIPMYFETEKALFESALCSLSGITPKDLRIVIIPNTLFLADCLVSEPLLIELKSRSDIIITDTPQEIRFDDDGSLLLRVCQVG